MCLQIGDVEDIVNIFESPPEIQPVGCLPNMLQHPERTYKASPKLPSASQVKYFQREQHFFSHLMLLQWVVLVEVALLILLGSLGMVPGLLDKLIDVLYKVSSSRSPTLTSHNSINR